MTAPDSFDSPDGRTYSTPETAGQAGPAEGEVSNYRMTKTVKDKYGKLIEVGRTDTETVLIPPPGMGALFFDDAQHLQAAIAAAAPAPAADDAEKATRKRNCPGESACRARGTYRMSGICCQASWYEREEADSALVLADGEVIATRAYSGGAIVICFGPGAPTERAAELREAMAAQCDIPVFTVADVTAIRAWDPHEVAAAAPAPAGEGGMLLSESQQFQLSEARDILATWDANSPGGISRETVLADQVRALLAIVDQHPARLDLARAETAAIRAAAANTARELAEVTAERDRLRYGIERAITHLEESAAATSPSKKSAIEVAVAGRLRALLDQP